MPYHREHLKVIVLAAIGTSDDELPCGDCWAQVDRFAELVLNECGAAEEMPLVEEHLRRCPDCAEEFNALIRALKGSAPMEHIAVNAV